jgi:hypothetical protein
MANSQSVQQIQQEQTERQQWAGLDPVTLVAAARKSLYSQIPSNGGDLPVSVSAPLEELITRFEQQTRASLGTQAMQHQGGQGGQQGRQQT